MELERRRSSGLDRLDDALLVVVAVVGALFALKVVGWVIGTVLFVVKVAVVAAIAFVALRVVSRRQR
jgi:Flp pilus assembly protein TadB